MSRLYGPNHRGLQDRFESRSLADHVEQRVVATEIGAVERAFIEGRDMFWLSSIDDRGRPTVSYKGGDPGFVRVLDANTLAFPSYDGNGMFYSMGNIVGNENVGLLFIDFENPHRLRVQGTASIDESDPLLAEYVESQLIVRVRVSELFRNCPRYVHKYEKARASKYVPRAEVETPLAGWKQVDDVQHELTPGDREKAKRLGKLRTREEYTRLVKSGHPDA